MKGAVVITGVREIDRKLRLLEPRVQKKVVRQAMRAGLKILQAEVKVQVPVRTGLTRSAVQIRALRARKRGSVSLEVRISGKKEGLIVERKSGKRVFYPAVVEYGREGVAPDPFMRRSFEAKGEQAKDAALYKLLQGVLDEVHRT
jgi:HK97 gp10 family phage protein